ncbi:PREDICTED: heterogeneous nuclear ribonucleoprotein A1 [Bactrocera latifrons]|uniref:heterogeneous nuclear ribonucleoprotein A1 n=1 Tax=Bactrocera latifrons TaxID=174628 RepID=UPI0008DC75EF|nr:PREDICTED: heterogeneous nuclear ribonucleoprotein A1 [Bactrocera latifrons]
MATKIFVGNLPPGTKPEELRRLFEDYGVVVECDVMNRCGFVHMETKEMANTAITALHASEFKGQMIVVELGRPKDRKANADNGRVGNIRSRGAARAGGGRNSGPGNRGGRPGGRDSDINDGGNNRQNFGNNSGRGAPKNKFNQGSGTIRNDHFKPQRNMPYNRRNDGPAGISTDASGMFGGNQRGNFNSGNASGSRGFDRGVSDGGQQNFHNWDKQTFDGNSHFGGMNNFNDTEGYGNNSGGGYGGNKGFGGQGQDRRGFALPMSGRGGGGGQRFGNGNTAFAGGNSIGSFRGSGMQNNAGPSNNSTDGLFSRRNNNGSDGYGNNMPSRSGFHGSFGNGQGDGNAKSGGFRRDDGGNNERFSAQNNYSSNFPPLGAHRNLGFGGHGGAARAGRGGGNQRNGPRQNAMPYQRF